MFEKILRPNTVLGKLDRIIENQYILEDVIVTGISNHKNRIIQNSNQLINVHKDILTYCAPDETAEMAPTPMGQKAFRTLQWCIQRLAGVTRPNLEQTKQLDNLKAVVNAWCTKRTFFYEIGESYKKSPPLEVFRAIFLKTLRIYTHFKN